MFKMGMLENGLDKIRDLFSAFIDGIESGTGTTEATQEDTDLENPISSSESSKVTLTNYDQMFVKEGTLLGINAGGESVSEVIWKRRSPEKAISRITFQSVTHNNSEDLIVETIWFIKGKR